jgi:hypothetical protein
LRKRTRRPDIWPDGWPLRAGAAPNSIRPFLSHGITMLKTSLAATMIAAALATGPSVAATIANQAPLDASASGAIRSNFGRLMELANRHDLKALHEMFWRSPSVLLVAKSATPSEGNWAGFWGNDAVDQKLHDIAASGPVELVPDMAKLKIVGLTRDVAESYVPLKIIVSYCQMIIPKNEKFYVGDHGPPGPC